MVGVVENPIFPPLELDFSIPHQKVELDIDFSSRSLRGRTELIVNPHSTELKIVRLNCRQCRFKSLRINGKLVPLATALSYEDPYERASLPWNATVHHSRVLEQKIDNPLSNTLQSTVAITLPRHVRIEELDPFSADAQNLLLSKSLGSKRDSDESTALDLAQSTKTAVEQTARFTPITVSAEFVIERIRDGLQFVGCEQGDLRYPHVYTPRSLSPGSSSSLFPTLDNITSRCTWEISIKCPKTLGDAFGHNAPSPIKQETNGTRSSSNVGDGNHHNAQVEDESSGFSDEDRALDLMVVCSGDLTDEITDPVNPKMKTTSFICATAVAPQHIGFAIGPFEHADLAKFRESDEDDKLGQNAVPLHGFCLPGRADELRNTCLPIAKAIDYFTLTYGSYPFSSYKICFLDDMVTDSIDVASLSILSNRLLFLEDIIEPIDQVTRKLVHALSYQWIGVNIIPKEPPDTWVVVGVAYFITDTFMRKLSGNNEYRYRQKKAADRVCELDIARPSLYDTGAIVALDSSQLEFMALKAPLVLFILDRRLTKASGSSGLSRIISRVFLNAKVGDLSNGELSTAFFLRTCEKLGHAKLDTFFTQWVYGAGCPRFRVTQRFNKKKLVVEMLIQQVQGELPQDRDLEKDSFIRDIKEEIHNIYAGPVQSAFTGPMTIRIHEADGTPYEHIVELKDGTTKFDIPYNTKYKRLKRSRRQKERAAISTTGDYSAEGQDDVLLYCLGDVLQSEEEISDWKLGEWGKEDEDRMSLESYEWIRMDADFEWICRMSITMPGYMYLSQLQQDRDVVAQLESIQYMAIQREHPLVSTILVRTLMDTRYFHGIRTAAAAALVKQAKDEIGWLGLYHLEKAFEEFFCFAGSKMTRPNDFKDRASYYVQCAIPQALARVRDNSGKSPFRVRAFLFEKLRYNDNSNNEFSDCHYLAVLMKALAEAISSNPAPTSDGFDAGDENDDTVQFHDACLDEIDRYRRIDEWIPSYHNVLSTVALDCKRTLMKSGVIPARATDFLQYTRDSCSDVLRVNAFANVMDLCLFKNSNIVRWFIFVMGKDPSPYIRERLRSTFGKTLEAVAIGENQSSNTASINQPDGLIIEQDSSTEARQADLARKQTISGALNALRAEISDDTTLKRSLWKDFIESPEVSLRELGEVLEICSQLYEEENSMVVTLRYPRYWSCRLESKGKLRFQHTDRVRTRQIPKLQLKANGQASRSSPTIKRENSVSAVPRTILKPPKKPASNSLPPATPSTAGSPPLPGESGRPKLTIKLNLKGKASKLKQEQ